MALPQIPTNCTLVIKPGNGPLEIGKDLLNLRKRRNIDGSKANYACRTDNIQQNHG